MNRELKFRIWNIVNEEYCYFDSEDKWYYSIGLDGNVRDGNGNPYDENHVVQQYTGLKDKNGKEIYEGDILNRQNDTLPVYYEVIWDNEAGGLATKQHRHHNKLINHLPIYPDSFRYLEVVGNIFENPELLKE